MNSEQVGSAIDLKEIVLAALEKEHPETHLKILRFQELINLKELPVERYSIAFLLDLFYIFELGSTNIQTIMQEVSFLEGKESKSRTKPASQFTKKPLKGLWHKHYYDGGISSLSLNLGNALRNYGIPYFEKKIQEAQESGEERFVTVEDITHIVNDAVTGNLQRRTEEEKITGEWVVFAVHENANYYLCLAKHQDGDENILEKINSSCILEFPFLKEILT